MGSVSIDVKKKEREYELFTFSDYNVVKYIILYRSKLDVAYGASINKDIYQSGDIFDFNEELIVMYASLDSLLNSIKIKDKDRLLLDLIFDGNTISDVIESYDFPRKTAYRTLDRIIEKIIKKNDEDWINSMKCQVYYKK